MEPQHGSQARLLEIRISRLAGRQARRTRTSELNFDLRSSLSSAFLDRNANDQAYNARFGSRVFEKPHMAIDAPAGQRNGRGPRINSLFNLFVERFAGAEYLGRLLFKLGARRVGDAHRRRIDRNPSRLDLHLVSNLTEHVFHRSRR